MKTPVKLQWFQAMQEKPQHIAGSGFSPPPDTIDISINIKIKIGKDHKSSNQHSWTYQGWQLLCLINAVLPAPCGTLLFEPRADVSALYEVYVLSVVIARPHQDTQEVQIITQVLGESRLHTAERDQWNETHLLEPVTEITWNTTVLLQRSCVATCEVHAVYF